MHAIMVRLFLLSHVMEMNIYLHSHLVQLLIDTLNVTCLASP